jgi:hypothetical protein
VLSRAITILSFLCASTVAATAAVPFDSATVTRVENKVSVGQGRDGRATQQRPATVSDVVGAQDYVLTETESRAELQFRDKSIVRVGQNTVFSFDAGSRTLSLQKGAMLFYVPPGTGGKIKTPSLTAAITGTIGKCTPNLIAVISGSLDTPWGVVNAGQAIRWENGRAIIFKYDPKEATTGLLWAWGPLPELPGVQRFFDPRYGPPDQHWFDLLDIAVLNPQLNNDIPLLIRPRNVRTPRPQNEVEEVPPY